MVGRSGFEEELMMGSLFLLSRWAGDLGNYITNVSWCRITGRMHLADVLFFNFSLDLIETCS